MLSSAWSAALVGVEAVPVEIETHVRSGLPGYTVVGLPQKSVRESRERVLSAIRSSELPVPRGAITVSMAPADLRKDGALFDLPLAMGMLAASGDEELQGALGSWFMAGELALDGRLRPVRGVLAMAELVGRVGGCLVVPIENLPEAQLVTACSSCGVATLAEAIDVLLGRSAGRAAPPAAEDSPSWLLDLADVAGQVLAKRALEIAAVGGHNLLFSGPPGSGKTMLARRLPGILPDLTDHEAMELTRVHSIAGLLGQGAGLLRARPFRAPHHSISRAGLIGGGTPPQPGEVSLALHGVLFLDELPEFRRDALESLRQPLESGEVHLRRVGYSVSLPATVALVASCNLCPCGFLGVGNRCTCDPSAVARYRSRISGPILDRMDLVVEFSPVTFDDLQAGSNGARSAAVRNRVIAARDFARAEGRLTSNARMADGELAAAVGLDREGSRVLRRAVEQLGSTARGVNRILRVARSVADLAGSGRVRADHVAEAIQFRG